MKRTNYFILLFLFITSQVFAQQSQSFAEYWFGMKPQNVQKGAKVTPKRAPAKVGLRSATDNPGDIITLDLSDPTNPTSFVLNAKNVWVETYNESDYPFLEFNNSTFNFSHLGAGEGDSWDGTYWDGFTYSKNADNTDYGAPGNSGDWVSNQWGNMAGGGIQTDAEGNVLKGGDGTVLTDPNIPYLLGYWGFYEGYYDYPPLSVVFNDVYQAEGVYVNNSPWPYYGNIRGDGFARALDQPGDYFKLIIHGMDENYEDNGKQVEYYLAQNVGGTLIQSPNWEWIDLSALGEVGGIYFTMESTDNSYGYPNTAIYFCMDKLQVKIAGEPEDTEAPTAPTNLKKVAGETTIELSWTASTDNVAVAGYNVYVDGVLVGTVTGTSYTITGLSPATTYNIEVEAFDDAGNISEKVSATISTIDETPPTAPTNLEGTATETTISLSWTASTDNVTVAGYNIYVDGVFIVEGVTGTSYTITGLSPATTYNLEVEAFDAAGNTSEKTSITISTADEADETAPTAPSNLEGVAGETTIELSWTASIDNIAVAGYNVYVDGILVETVTGTSYTITGLSPVTTYNIEVEAFDEAGNTSEKASAVISTIDETAPTVPTNLEGTATETTISLSWTASTDNVAVAGYNIYLNGVFIVEAVTGTSYIITGLSPATTYNIEVEAFDYAGNKSEKVSIIITTDIITGLKEGALAGNKMSIYPNPFTDYIVVNTTTDGIATVYNLSGNAILSLILKSGSNCIETSGLSKGIYVLKFNENTIKIVK